MEVLVRYVPLEPIFQIYKICYLLLLSLSLSAVSSDTGPFRRPWEFGASVSHHPDGHVR